ncbi:MAG: glycosyltransferase [Candidatus Didemnitutus sp.]|nr:glycosyltransferase [Candidatus Didemnitutus sp.]
MRICHIVPSLEERHGGPSKSARALANAQAAGGATVELLTTQEPAQKAPNTAHDYARVFTFVRQAPLALCRASDLRAHLLATPADCIHHHSVWLLTLRYAREAAQRQSAPLVIAPRGMFSPWAYAHRRWRKRLAELVVHPSAFRDAAGWHVTSDDEAADVRRLGFTQPICVAPNGVGIPTATELGAARTFWHAHCPSTRNRPIALFYSRFHRKKRLRELFDLWLAEPRGEWFLLLVGLPEEYSVAEIHSWIEAAGATSSIGVFDGTNQPAPFAVASLFVLPSHSENFGLVIAEALAAGVPALVTDTTPWPMLSEKEAGWCVPWASFGATLSKALACQSSELVARGRAGARWMETDFTWAGTARRLRDFYHSLRHA